MQGVEGGAAEDSGSQAWVLATSTPLSPTIFCTREELMKIRWEKKFL